MHFESYKITINNWEKHNKKLKQGHTHFLISKRIFNDDKIAQLKPVEFQIYLYCLTVSADLMQSQFTLSAQSLPRYFRVRSRLLHTCLIRLQSLQLVTIENLSSFNTLKEKNRIEENIKEYNAQSKNKIQNSSKQNDQKSVEKIQFDFEKLYELYPKKIGKSGGLKICKQKILTQCDYENLEKSILNYRAYCDKNLNDPKFIKHFSTFMNCWKDFLDADAGSTNIEFKKQNSKSINADLWEKIYADESSNENPLKDVTPAE